MAKAGLLRRAHFWLAMALSLATLFVFLPDRAKPALAASGFVTANGSGYFLNGQPLHLRGVNMNNEQALGASIGSGNMGDINVGSADYKRIAGWGLNLV